MQSNQIKNDVFYVGANDPDRKLFDELIPLPDGTSYNSYLIKGSEKTALIDSVDPEKKEVLFENLRRLKIESIDYVIAHHGEQDHSGTIPYILEKYPMAKVVTNPKCESVLKDLLLLADEDFIVVEDGQEISLGNKTLKFIFAPWVHWPDTMLTFLPEDKIIFTCDFLGTHYSLEELFIDNPEEIYTPAKRYYAEIMMPFRTSVVKNLELIKDLDFDTIAPSHGPVHTDREFIINCYKDWSSDDVRNEVILPYVSMHGSTEKMVKHFKLALEKNGIIVKEFNLSEADTGELAMALVDAATVVLGCSTVLVGPHPKAMYAAYLVKVLRPKTRNLSIIGSFGWGGKMVEQLVEILKSLKAEVIEPVIAKGYPKERDLQLLDELAGKIKTKHKDLGIL
jgi:flavorubredoxin